MARLERPRLFVVLLCAAALVTFENLCNPKALSLAFVLCICPPS